MASDNVATLSSRAFFSSRYFCSAILKLSSFSVNNFSVIQSFWFERRSLTSMFRMLSCKGNWEIKKITCHYSEWFLSCIEALITANFGYSDVELDTFYEV